VFAVTKSDLWGIFLFMTFKDRRQFLFDLFTRVGDTVHLLAKLKEVDEEALGVEDDRIRYLFFVAFQVSMFLTGLASLVYCF
jgi:hypothetical protein